MDLDDQINRFDELIYYIRNELPKFARSVALTDLIALITNRVVQKGQNYLGNSFSVYSTNTVAAWRFWGKSRTQAAERKVRAKARARGSMSYVEFRQLNNLLATNKNFEFTGEMWRKFGIIKEQISPNRFRFIIGGTTTASQEKIDENSNREGISIIEASAAEVKLVEIAVLNWIDEQADRILNS